MAASSQDDTHFGAEEVTEYLKNTVGPVLVLALAEITINRPKDPIHYLGHWLRQWHHNQKVNRPLDQARTLEVMLLRNPETVQECKVDDNHQNENEGESTHPPSPSQSSHEWTRTPDFPHLPPGYGGPMDFVTVQSPIFTCLSSKIICPHGDYPVFISVEPVEGGGDDDLDKSFVVHFNVCIESATTQDTTGADVVLSAGQISVQSGHQSVLHLKINSVPERAYYLTIRAEGCGVQNGGEIFLKKVWEETAVLLTTSHDLNLLAHVDRPIYQPGDLVQFRILLLNRDMKPLTTTTTDSPSDSGSHGNGRHRQDEPFEVRVTIVDSDEKIVKTWKDVKFNLGLFSSNFTLTPESPLGGWTVRAEILNDPKWMESSDDNDDGDADAGSYHSWKPPPVTEYEYAVWESRALLGEPPYFFAEFKVVDKWVPFKPTILDVNWPSTVCLEDVTFPVKIVAISMCGQGLTGEISFWWKEDTKGEPILLTQVVMTPESKGSIQVDLDLEGLLRPEKIGYVPDNEYIGFYPYLEVTFKEQDTGKVESVLCDGFSVYTHPYKIFQSNPDLLGGMKVGVPFKMSFAIKDNRSGNLVSDPDPTAVRIQYGFTMAMEDDVISYSSILPESEGGLRVMIDSPPSLVSKGRLSNFCSIVYKNQMKGFPLPKFYLEDIDRKEIQSDSRLTESDLIKMYRHPFSIRLIQQPSIYKPNVPLMMTWKVTLAGTEEPVHDPWPEALTISYGPSGQQVKLKRPIPQDGEVRVEIRLPREWCPSGSMYSFEDREIEVTYKGGTKTFQIPVLCNSGVYDQFESLKISILNRKDQKTKFQVNSELIVQLTPIMPMVNDEGIEKWPKRQLTLVHYIVMGRSEILTCGQMKVHPSMDREGSFEFKLGCPSRANPEAVLVVYYLSISTKIGKEDKEGPKLVAGAINFYAVPDPKENNFLKIFFPQNEKNDSGIFRPGGEMTLKIQTNKLLNGLPSLLVLQMVDGAIRYHSDYDDFELEQEMVEGRVDLTVNEGQPEVDWSFDCPSRTIAEAGLVILTNAGIDHVQQKKPQIVYERGAGGGMRYSDGMFYENGPYFGNFEPGNFPQTWIWEEIPLKGGGEKEFELMRVIPDTITSWLITGYLLNEECQMTVLPEEIEVTVCQK